MASFVKSQSRLSGDFSPTQSDVSSKENYFNLNAYRFSSSLHNRKSLNVSGYINIYSPRTNKFTNGCHSNKSTKECSHNNCSKLDTKNDLDNNISASSTGEDSDYGHYLEVGHPEMNYFKMDMRPLVTAARKTEHGHGEICDDMTYIGGTWRRRSLTPDTAELMERRRHHSVIYADLVINGCGHGSCHGNRCHDDVVKKKEENRLNYLEIDIHQTMTLAELDSDLRRITRSHNNPPDRQSSTSACQLSLPRSANKPPGFFCSIYRRLTGKFEKKKKQSL